MQKRIIFLLLVGIHLIFAVNLKAATFNVSTPANFQTALTTAQSNGEDDTIEVASGTYTISTVLGYLPTENNSLTIRGEDRATTILDGDNANQIFKSQVLNLTNAHLTIENITFQNGSTALIGAAISAASNSGIITITNCQFSNNTAPSAGAVSLSSTGAVIFTDNFVLENTATETTAGGVSIYSELGPVTVSGNRIAENSAVVAAGGIGISSDNADIDFSDNQVIGNTVSATQSDSGNFGGVYIQLTTGSITFDNNTISNNSTTGKTPIVDVSGIAGGAYIESHDVSVSMNGNQFNGNTANNIGGAVGAKTTTGDIIFTNNLVYDNSANEIAGGVGLESKTGTIYAVNNTIADNSATNNNGGGLLIQVGEDDTNTTSATAHIYNNIVWGNSAGGEGDDIYIEDNPDADAFQGATYLHFNNFTDRYVVDGTLFTESDNLDQDPQLSATYHLPAGSPCVDAGDSTAPEIPDRDIDNHNRTLDGDDDGVAEVDIGADEYTVPAPAGGGSGGSGCFIGSLPF